MLNSSAAAGTLEDDLIPPTDRTASLCHKPHPGPEDDITHMHKPQQGPAKFCRLQLGSFKTRLVTTQSAVYRESRDITANRTEREANSVLSYPRAQESAVSAVVLTVIVSRQNHNRWTQEQRPWSHYREEGFILSNSENRTGSQST
ncbi:hypothetical protein SKAU_G00044810 [Synaphobranchus kaupii]|uniref:Uncharacterized protein n=1 Tax=Synaphobranchus kaupii TaxID=118154 RepID=A0A9Q1G291_SYNKA|nr:hypothetical protein SKAU_G00044810 [Synaphobranchus kaupii]